MCGSVDLSNAGQRLPTCFYYYYNIIIIMHQIFFSSVKSWDGLETFLRVGQANHTLLFVEKLSVLSDCPRCMEMAATLYELTDILV